MTLSHDELKAAEERLDDHYTEGDEQSLYDTSWLCVHDGDEKCPGACPEGYWDVHDSCAWHAADKWRPGAEVIDGFCHSCDQGYVHEDSARRLPWEQRTRAILVAWDKELRGYVRA